MKRTAISLISGLVLALLLVACGSDDPEPPTGVDSPAPPEAAAAAIVKAASETIVGTKVEGDDNNKVDGDCDGGTARTVALEDPAGSGAYQFDPSELSFAKGECVNFTFTSENEFHTFTVSALEIDVSVDGGATETLSFTFESAGEFELICVPHGNLGMVGTITVSE